MHDIFTRSVFLTTAKGGGDLISELGELVNVVSFVWLFNTDEDDEDDVGVGIESKSMSSELWNVTLVGDC